MLQGRKASDYVRSILRVTAKTFVTGAEFVEAHGYFFRPVVRRDLSRAQDSSGAARVSSLLDEVAKQLQEIGADEWRADLIWRKTMELIDTTSVGTATREGADVHKATHGEEERAKRKEVFHYLRWALTGGLQGPSLHDTMAILGRDNTLARLHEAAALAGTEERI